MNNFGSLTLFDKKIIVQLEISGKPSYENLHYEWEFDV